MKLYFKILIFLAFTDSIYSQVPTDAPLQLRAQFNGQFDYKIIGNTLTTADNATTTTATCPFIASSSANLTLNANENIVAAYLYWFGIGDGTFDPDVEVNGNNFIADEISIVDPVQNNFTFFYSAFKEISNIVQGTGSGNYVFSGLNLNPIIGSYCSNSSENSGWAILVIYEDNTLPIQQVNVYDGLNSVFGFEDNSSSTINLSNLNIIDTQNSRMGYLAWEGSTIQVFNESVSFNGNLLSTPFLNPADNPFNGTNTYTGATDLWNMDLDVFDISNFLNIGDTQATLTFTSAPRRFIQNVVTVTRSVLPDATIQFVEITNQDACDDRDISITLNINNFDSSDVLQANTPFSIFVLSENNNEIFLDTFFTQNNIPIDGSETQTVDVTIPDNIPNISTLILKANTIQDGTNPVNESNVLNNRIEVELFIPQTPVLINPPTPLSTCGNLSTNDPIDLTQNSLNSLGFANPEDFNIQYFTSDSDAQSGVNPIPNPESFVLTSNPQDIFIRIENSAAPACFTVESFEASYQYTPDIQQTINLNQCQENNEIVLFDLTTNDASAIGVDDPSNTNISYHETLAAAQNNTSAIPNPTAYPPPNNSQTIFIRAENATNPGCFSTASFDINTFPVAINNINDLNIQACIFPGESAVFDLTENSALALGNQDSSAIQISYYLSETEAINEQNPIPNPTTYENLSNPQPIWIRLENINSPVNCFLTAEFSISVANAAQVNFSPDSLQVCDTDNDGFAAFDLSQSIDEISLNNPDISVSFHLTADEAENNTNPISSPFTNTVANDQTVFFRTEETGNGCSFTGTLEIEVLANPELDSSQPVLSACAVGGNTASFDLTDINASIILNNDSSTFEVAYFLSENEALTNTNPIQNPANFVNTSNPQPLWIRVSDSDNCVSVASFELDVLTGAVIDDVAIDDVILCSETPEQLLANVDLTQFDDSINPNPAAETLVVYYEGLGNFNAGISIDNPQSFEVNTTETQIIAEVVNLETLCVSPEQVSFDILVNPLPDFALPESAQICIDLQTDEVIENGFSPPILDTGLSETNFSFEWSLNGEVLDNTTSSFETTNSGIYEVNVTNLETGCAFSQSINVEEVNPPLFNVDILSQAFSSGNTAVEVNNIQGQGEVEFQLDNGNWVSLEVGQSSLIFENLSGGNHVIRGRDALGCGVTEIAFSILSFPPFFTPNQDGFNDFWNIRSLRNQPDAKIYIFDRYGKLLRQLSPLEAGWDGIYQGRQMPAQDYWFRVEFTDPQSGEPAVFVEHFTLKR
ncbi:MAG: T9SS type B sorting domain-containing protein [Psychroflexus sp.]|nr:T9SS type B sorting domain-containing protein [Psychroflexus sp.]